MRSPAIRYHGAKFRIAPWVISHFPAHTRYVEPFGGGAGVLLCKTPSYAEVYNDLDGDIVNFFRVLRDPLLRTQLIDLCTMTPFAREEFEEAYEPFIELEATRIEDMQYITAQMVERARRTAVRAAMGFGSAGATKNSTGFRTDTRRSYGTAQHLWTRYPDHIAQVGQRFSGVLIENRPATAVMTTHDGPDTLHYCDPPYVLSTRDPRAGYEKSRYYRHEMEDDQHLELLAFVKRLEGFAIVSGYATEIYDDMLAGWERHTMMARMSSGRGTGTREEVLWLSPSTSAALKRPRSQHKLDLTKWIA